MIPRHLAPTLVRASERYPVLTLTGPHHENFNKRIAKSPKLYFFDTGLLCYLLQIRSAEELARYARRGAVFENFAVAEFAKHCHHGRAEPRLAFWRDHRATKSTWSSAPLAYPRPPVREHDQSVAKFDSGVARAIVIANSASNPTANIIPSYATGHPITLIGSNRLANLQDILWTAKQPNNPVATFRQVQGTVRRGANALFGFYRVQEP